MAKTRRKLQRVENHAAWIVCVTSSRQQSALKLCHSLQWLTVQSRTDFKLATLCFKSWMTR